MISPHRCPACHDFLVFDPKDKTNHVGCRNPRCPSEMADRGMIGSTPDEAAKKLIEAMKEKEDWL